MAATDTMPAQTSLFQVFLRLRPPQTVKQQEPWLLVEPPTTSVAETDQDTTEFSTHITLQPPNDSRKRAIERFGFTKIFREQASQTNIFEESGTVESIRNLLDQGKDGLVATLGVTGSGKSHTILGTKSQRGLTQMTLDVLFRSIGPNIRGQHHPDMPMDPTLLAELQACDASEAQLLSAASFLETVYDTNERARMSRAQTPMIGYGSRAQTPQADTAPPHHTRRPPMPNPNSFAQNPDVSEFSFEAEPEFDYAVIVSMYEVYNDRIFDLLSSTTSGPSIQTRQAAALQKGLMRRPLLFKNTEMSLDRKVVAGLRKIVCSNYEEAMTVLEAGLTERRVAGTGSNSVSSRSHGFFCIEVKKQARTRYHSPGAWTGATLSIVDLAGSERARNAKTTGSTLAEAGKINESLMYLGQCLQVQSDCQQDGSKPIVPFRQCKLTELLFSNSFPSHASTHKTAQRAVMIVTADPQGDFNATSQILRYSALAREVTVPRIPSVTSTIVTGAKPPYSQPSGRTTPHDHYFSAQELEQATNEVHRLAEECETLAVRLTEEEIKRTEAELRLQAAEERLTVTEQEIREECWQQMEQTLEDEKERWRAAWTDERLNHEEYVDGKIDILGKTAQFSIHEDGDMSARLDELHRENDMLRAKLQALNQEMVSKSPTKKSKTNGCLAPSTLALQESNANLLTNPFLSALKARDSGSARRIHKTPTNDDEQSRPSPRKASLRSSTSSHAEPVDAAPNAARKSTRKLTARQWDLGDVNEL